MKTKKERLEDIKKLERKALKILKATSEPGRKTKNPRGLEINKLLETVILLENQYDNDFGTNPGNYEPKTKKKRYTKREYKPDLWS